MLREQRVQQTVLIGPRAVQRVHDGRFALQQRAADRARDPGMVVHDVEVAHLEVRRERVVGVVPGVPELVRVGRRRHRRDELRLRARAARGEQRHVVAGVDEAVGEQRNHELDPAVARRGTGNHDRRDHRDAHRSEANALSGTASVTPRCRSRGRRARARPSGAPTASSRSSRARRSASRAARARSIPTTRRGCSSATRGSSPSCASRSTERRPSRWPRPPPTRSARVFVLRGHPSRGRADSHLVLFRRRYIGRGMREDIEIENYGEEAAFCSVELLIGADFADLFEVKEGRVHKQGKLGVTRRAATGASRSRTSGSSFSAFHPRRLLGRAADLRLARALRGHRARRAAAGRACMQVTPVIGELRDHAAPPVRPAGRAVDARRAPRGVDAAPARGHHRRRPVPRAARPLDARRRRPAHLRSRVPRPGGGGGRRAVVHDAVRPRLADHVVDDDARRSRPRARDAADARALPGRERRPAHRGGAGPHPARDALRRDRRRSRSAAVASTTARSTRRRCS